MTIPTALINQLRVARRVAVLTGSGVSAESGVPTFREAQTGMWEQFKPEELATPRAFQRNPRLVWEWYEWRRQLVSTAKPNPAHFALVQLERLYPHFDLITQNVDGLHQSAGSRQVVELHGNITRTKCANEGKSVTQWKSSGEIPPRCPDCGGLLRPDVVWFEEQLPQAALARAIEASTASEVFISIGTSAVVYPAAELPFQAQRGGAVLVEINLLSTPLTDHADFVLTGAAGSVLPALLAQLET